MTCGLSVFLAATLSAQETPRFSFDLGAGFTTPVGNTARHLDTGWNIQGGAGYNFSPYLGAKLELGFNWLGINSGTLNNLGFPGGNVHVFSATIDPIVHLNPKGRFDVYLIGGGGIYHQTQEFTQPTVTTFTAFDPFFGGFFPVAVPTTEILSSYSVNKPGINGGAGIEFGSKWRGKFFAEARYHRIFVTSDRHMDFVPVSFGFRW
ncbi:MAG: porin family protein [Acidobacteriia bacterium]|nr:porin family protein [Terriglobia bacterium]